MTFNVLMIPVWLFMGLMVGIWAHVMIACVRDWLGYMRALPGIDTQIRKFRLTDTKDFDSID